MRVRETIDRRLASRPLAIAARHLQIAARSVVRRLAGESQPARARRSRIIRNSFRHMQQPLQFRHQRSAMLPRYPGTTGFFWLSRPEMAEHSHTRANVAAAPMPAHQSPAHASPSPTASHGAIGSARRHTTPDQPELPQQPRQATPAPIRVHTSQPVPAQQGDNDSENAVRDMGADAVTIGNDIFFAPGKFAPHTARGHALLVHELSHIRQQQQPGTNSDPAQLEREALANERLAYRQFATGQLPAPAARTGTPPATPSKMIVHASGLRAADAAVAAHAGSSPAALPAVSRSAGPMAAAASRSLEGPGADPGTPLPSREHAETGSATQELLETMYQSLRIRLEIEKERMGS